MAQQNKLGKVATTVTGNSLDNIRVTYHSTDIVTVTKVKGKLRITLDTGGWFTPTTKTRMNQASNQFGLGYRVYQDKGSWYVKKYNGKEIPFVGNFAVFTA